MVDEKLLNYVGSERSRGLSDEIIRAELLKAGWNEGDVTAALLSGVVTGPASLSLDNDTTTKDRSTMGLYFLLPGALLFLASSSILITLQGLYASQNSDGAKIMYGMFALAHLFNATAAFFFFHAAWQLSRALLYKIWIGLLSVVVAAFALLSFIHFASAATGIDFFEKLQLMSFHDEGLLLVIYFILLPLQAVVFLALLITCWVLRFLRRRVGGKLLPSSRLTTGLLIFFAMAILALLDLVFMLEWF